MMTVDAPLSSAIFDINPGHIITTNYDQLLESSRNVFREQYQVIVNDKDLLNADKSKYIIKMHGDLSANNIVLKEQDYLDYSQNHVLMELFIKSLLTDHIVLFLGYSLTDYNMIPKILNQTKSIFTKALLMGIVRFWTNTAKWIYHSLIQSKGLPI